MSKTKKRIDFFVPSLYRQRVIALLQQLQVNIKQYVDMDVFGLLIGIVNCLWAPLTRQVQYLRSLEENYESLRGNIEEINGRENDIRLEVDRAVRHLGKNPKNEVQIWLRNVEKVTEDVHIKIESELQSQGKCMKGCFPNCSSRVKLSKLIERKTKEVVELQRKGGFPNGLFADTSSLDRRQNSMPTTQLVGETVGKILDRIWESLMDTDIKMIGIYGMGGVGKTTIMMHINNQLNEAQVFDNVIWVTVSKALNLERLQHDIGRAIDLDLSDDEDVVSRASKLFRDLLRKKRFVLILDDLWCKFPLEKVGIPHPNKDNGCKLVFTTRLMEVCRGMETQREIKVEVLSKHEAWVLFNDKSGGTDVIKLSPEIETIAKQMTEECGGLPLAIITVGRAMRRVDNIRIWRNALEELKNSKAEIEGMEDDVFARLKFSYNHLKNDRIRACLLYCALYPEDYKIDFEELIEYWMAEGFIDEVGDREKEIDKGHSVLNELKDSCMLESVGTKWVKMHDLVRDLAISVTRENSPLFIVKARIGLKRFPKEWVEDVERVSLMDNGINLLSDHAKKWSKLSTLFLQRNPLFERIPYSFFEHMNNLKVLDLSDTNIELLPESISNLNNLRALFLRFCRLKKLPSLTKLKELRVLDVSYTRIREVPNDIEGMVNLRRFDLSYTERLKSFPAEVIPKFPHLENLSMFKSRWRWSSDKGGACFEEITNAAQLANLGLSFKDLRSFISYVKSKHWQVLKSYHLGIGLLSSFIPISKRNCSVEIQGCNLVSDGSSIVLPDNTLQLALQGCHDINRLSKLPCISNLSELKECYVSRCNRMEYIVSAEDNTLLSLERLILRKLLHLTALCDGIAKSCTLTRLKILHIHGCDGLKNLFSLGFLQNLENLEEIEIWNSVLIEEIIEEPAGDSSNVILLPRLRRLYLSSLPELKSICRSSLVCNSLHTIDIWNCRKLKKLPFEIGSISFALKHIRGTKNWWDSLEWTDNTTKTLLLTFFREDKQEDEDDKHEDNTDIEEVEEHEEKRKDGVNEEADEYDDETDDEKFENAR